MSKTLLNLLLLVFIFTTNLLIAQGVEFNSNNNLISKRTSYNVFEYSQPKFTNAFSIAFSISIDDPLSFGYIFSVKNKNSTDSYSLSYINSFDNSGQIKFNLDAVKNIFTIPIKREFLGAKQWVDIELIFNPIENSIQIVVNSQKYLSKENVFENSIIPEIYFGKHDNVIEVPSMSIKNLKIKNGEKDYIFNFNENQGSDVFDTKSKRYGKIMNANWLISESYHWKERYSYTSKKVTSVTFDKKKQRFVFVNADSLVLYNFRKEETTRNTFKNDHPVPMQLGQSIIDYNSDKVYVYEVNDVADNKATIANLDINTLLWNVNTNQQLPTQRHHHNAFINKERNELIIFGGFGNQRLSNNFDVFNLNTNTWDLQPFTGDVITPRYFSGLAKINDNEILLFGGLGNKTGDQSIGKTYYYDCYRVNLKTKKIKKLWDIDKGNTKMVSSRDMVISKDSTAFYTISYPEYVASTHLQLYKYNISNGDYQILGDSIPMVSERIRTNADLYFNKDTEELFCVTQEFELEGGSNLVKIYSINAPPVSKSVIYNPINISKSNANLIYIILLGFISFGLLLIFFIKRRKKEQEVIKTQVKILEKFNIEDTQDIKKPNSISVFGDFTVIDRKGKDISYLFSPKIRQLFLYLFLSSKNKENAGKTSEKIHTALWPDSPPKKAKNLKNVTLNQLRNILTELDGIEAIYSCGKFFIDYKDELYFDYFNFVNQLDLINKDSLNKDSLTQLVQITRNGKFLKSIDDECFDKTKKNFEQNILEFIPKQIKKFNSEKNHSAVLGLTDILFNVDPISEIALYNKIYSLIKLGMKSQAKRQFNRFILNYKNLMGEDFPHTFFEVSRKNPRKLNLNN